MLTSLIRTVVPLVVGWLIAQPVVGAAGVTEEQATTAVSALVTVVYYAAARAAEHYVSPKFGWLLGKASAPAYGPPAD